MCVYGVLGRGFGKRESERASAIDSASIWRKKKGAWPDRDGGREGGNGTCG